MEDCAKARTFRPSGVQAAAQRHTLQTLNSSVPENASEPLASERAVGIGRGVGDPSE